MKINRAAALRYMGHFGEADERIMAVMDECEKGLLESAKPRYIYRVFDVLRENNTLSLKGCGFTLEGRDISQHIAGCEKAAVLAVTLSADADRFLRKQSLEDGLKGLASDAMASVLAEEVSEQARRAIIENMTGYSATWCYAAGYGDFPLSAVRALLQCVDAPRKIGVNCTASDMLTPQKSIVGIIGLSVNKVSGKVRGCAGCNMRKNCAYRKSGAGTCRNEVV